jgi:hypothetical protein
MKTLTQTTDRTADPLPEPGTILYFRAVIDRTAAERGLTPETWPA